MISIWMTIVTTLLLGVVYPFVVTPFAQVCARLNQGQTWGADRVA